MKIIDQNDNYTLSGGWWLELIDRKSGKVKFITSLKKDMFDGVTIEHALRWTDKRKWKPMYKANVK